MPWPTRSRRLVAFSSNLAGGTISWLVTVPVSRTYLVKDWRVYNSAATARAFALWAELDGAPYVIGHSGTIGAGLVGGESGRSVVLAAGQRLGISAGTTGTTGLYVSGAVLGDS